jgi:hypothetical protein
LARASAASLLEFGAGDDAIAALAVGLIIRLKILL